MNQITRLVAQLGWSEFQPTLAEGVIKLVLESGYAKTDGVIRRLSHQSWISPALNARSLRLSDALRATKFDPPSLKELAPDKLDQEAVRHLIRTGKAVEVCSDVILLSETFREAGRRVREFLGNRGSASVSELRDLLQSSRRVIIPLLEKLDRNGVTKRVGDRRVAP